VIKKKKNKKTLSLDNYEEIKKEDALKRKKKK